MFVGEPRPHSQQGVSAQPLSCAEISGEMQDSLPTIEMSEKERYLSSTSKIRTLVVLNPNYFSEREVCDLCLCYIYKHLHECI
jgi:hypothetical protein